MAYFNATAKLKSHQYLISCYTRILSISLPRFHWPEVKPSFLNTSSIQEQSSGR